MNDETKPQDMAEPSPASDGSRARLWWRATYFQRDGGLRIDANSSRLSGIWTVTLCRDGRWQAYLTGRIGERYFGTPQGACMYCEREEAGY